MPTPFDESGKIDATAFERFCERQIQDGATALVVSGTTGEAPTLSPYEHGTLVRIAVGIARGRIPVVAGAGSNSTAHAIELTKDAEKAGADAVLSIVPYYSKPTQCGLEAHFRAIAQSTEIPIILYDVPSRTACGLADDTIARLAELPRVIGLKDAPGDVTRPYRLRALVGRDFRLLSGDDATALAFVANGGNGCISVTANVAPSLCRSMYLAFKQGQVAKAQRLSIPVAQLTAALFCESSPAPLKYALSLLGQMKPNVRLPIVELANPSKLAVAAVLSKVCEGYGWKRAAGRLTKDAEPPVLQPTTCQSLCADQVLLRTAILGFCAVFGANGFALTLGGLLAAAMLCCIFIGALRQEIPLGQTLTHFDEAAAYAAIFCLALGTS